MATTTETLKPHTRPRVLYAEDDEMMAVLVQTILELEGCDVVHCRNGADALEQACQGEYALFLLDIQMPGKTGFEVLEGVRAMRRHRRAPIVMLTAQRSDDDVARALRLGADDFLFKPFAPPHLVARIRRHLQPVVS